MKVLPTLFGRDNMAVDDKRCTINHGKDSPSIRHLCRCDKTLQYVIHSIGELAYSPYEDGFSFLVDTVVGQMLSNKVTDVISARVYHICDGKISPSSLAKLSVSDLRGVGLSVAKSEYILGLSEHFYKFPNFFQDFPQRSDIEVMDELTKLRGIGSWSAKMYLIFVLDRQDILPFEDGAFQQAFAWLYPNVELSKSSIKVHCEKWSPYSSIASRYLYKALDSGLTKLALPDNF